MNHYIEPENDYDGEVAVNSCAGHGGFVSPIPKDDSRCQWSPVTSTHNHPPSVLATSPRDRVPCSDAFEHSITKAIMDLLRNRVPLQAAQRSALSIGIHSTSSSNSGGPRIAWQA